MTDAPDIPPAIGWLNYVGDARGSIGNIMGPMWGHPDQYLTVVEEHYLGNAVKYIWRADLKGNAIEDLEKAAWYVQREIAKRRKQEAKT
jgi:hypothetical protein